MNFFSGQNNSEPVSFYLLCYYTSKEHVESNQLCTTQVFQNLSQFSLVISLLFDPLAENSTNQPHLICAVLMNLYFLSSSMHCTEEQEEPTGPYPP